MQKKKSLLRYYCKFVTDDNKLVMILKGPANLKNMLKNLLSYFYDTLVGLPKEGIPNLFIALWTSWNLLTHKEISKVFATFFCLMKLPFGKVFIRFEGPEPSIFKFSDGL